MNSLHVSNILENNRNFQRIDKYYWKSSLEKGGSKNSSMKTSFLGSMYVWPTPSPQMYEWRSADDCSLPQVEEGITPWNSHKETHRERNLCTYINRWRLIDVKKLHSTSFSPKGKCKKSENLPFILWFTETWTGPSPHPISLCFEPIRGHFNW